MKMRQARSARAIAVSRRIDLKVCNEVDQPDIGVVIEEHDFHPQRVSERLLSVQ